MSLYIVHNAADDTCDGYEECDFCTNKVNPNCLEADEKNLAEEGGGYACSACADNYKEHFYQYNEAFYCVNIGDIVYDKPGKILGKCFYKSKDNSETICLENGRIAIWIKGKCLKDNNGWIFTDGELKAFYKDCCP